MKMKHHIAWVIGNGSVLVALAAIFPLSACQQMIDDNVRAQDAQNAMTARKNDLDAQIAKKGYAVVGKTPAGQPIYMIYVSAGWDTDRVYFTDPSKINAAVSTSRCGKNCITKGVTIQ